MSSGDSRIEQKTTGETSNPRKAYAPPAVSWTEETEIKANLASACDKVGGSGGQCDAAGGS
jgi:hypothetical protein